jgi:hypothetical protein
MKRLRRKGRITGIGDVERKKKRWSRKRGRRHREGIIGNRVGGESWRRREERKE